MVQRAVSGSIATPAPPIGAREALRRHPFNMRALTELAEADPLLGRALVRAANQQAPASPPLGAVEDAVLRLGAEESRRLVAVCALAHAFPRLAEAGIDTDELWRHLLAVALLAEGAGAAERLGAEAFTAGLLHDVGRMAMATFDPDRYRRVVEVARQDLAATGAEALLFGAGHDDWGVRIGWEWGLPAAIVAAIAEHHDPPADRPLAVIVAHARRAACALGIGDGVTPAPPAAATPPGAGPDAVPTPVAREALLQRIAGVRRAVGL